MKVIGRVIEEQKNYFIVDSQASGPVMATTSGTLKKLKSKVCTGDIVDVNIIDTVPPRGIITAIGKRTTFIRRPALANCSCLFCICTYKEPPLNLEALDRLLFHAHVHEVQPCIVFNKVDLLSAADHAEVENIIDSYRRAGYRVFATSAVTGEGISGIVDSCAGLIAAFAGQSGTGKSTLLSAVFPEVKFRIGRLSASATRGTHATTNVTLLPLPNGGYIADTPGLAFIDPPAVPEEDVVLYFPELARCIGACRYNDCVHDGEPGCSVIEKIEQGEIAPWRRTHYLNLYREMERKRKQYRKST